jgi:hypothetical protein
MNNTALNSDVKTWIFNNEATIEELTREIRDQRDALLDAEDFYSHDDIWRDYYYAAELLIGEEISRRLGISVDVIQEVLEECQDVIRELVK